jgi:PAS domain S-box-containing protein
MTAKRTDLSIFRIKPHHRQMRSLQKQGRANRYSKASIHAKMIRDYQSRRALTEKNTAMDASFDAIDAIGEAVVLCSAGGRIIRANSAFSELTDYNLKKLKGMDIRKLLPDLFDEEEGAIHDTIARVGLKKNSRDPEDALHITTANGDEKWVVPSLSTVSAKGGRFIAIVMMLSDVTSLIRAQQNLSHSERQYRELVENAGTIIMRVSPDLQITFVNEYAENFFGFSSGEIVGRNMAGTILPAIDSEGRDLVQQMKLVLESPELHSSTENENVCKDGRRVWIHWANRAIRDDKGRVREVLCVGSDHTDKKRLAKKAENYHRRLRSLADRLVSMEEKERRRISTHIHDTVIQTLSLANIRLGGIRSAVEAADLLEAGQKIEKVRGLIEGGIVECRSLMADLTPPLLYEVGLTPALQEFADKCMKVHGLKITVVEERKPEFLDDARKGLIFQSARELVINALKYAGPCEIIIRLGSNDAEVYMEICDNGRGFDPNRADLFSFDKEGGFGLFNIRERLQGLDGRFEIESEIGKGTTARVIVPLCASAS